MAGSPIVRVLSVASECVPLVKTGGLADVAGALPPALAGHRVEMRTLIPGYPAVMASPGRKRTLARYDDLFGGAARLLACRMGELDLLVLDAPHLYDRPGNIYLGPGGKDWPDNPERFAALCLVAARIAREGAGRWKPQIVHGHDWQAGLVPAYLEGTGVPTILTIHNIAFHGIAEPGKLEDLGLNPHLFTPGRLEYWGKISALKAGLTMADRLTTVSRTYAHELMTPEFGMGLDGVIRDRAADLTGIVNGIDLAAWNPATDPAIRPYKSARGKAANKSALQEEFGLPQSDGPLCVVVSRLTQQKGLDLLLQALPTLLDGGGQLILLGSGEAALEAAYRAETRHRNVAVRIGYDEPLSHRMMAGGDAILVPSRFEPCGLTQLYGLRYGTVPLVALTGGLADTVINASPAALATGCATGIQFSPVTADALSHALAQLCRLYADRPTWARLQGNGMKQPVGWDRSAAEYAALYREVLAA